MSFWKDNIAKLDAFQKSLSSLNPINPANTSKRVGPKRTSQSDQPINTGPVPPGRAAFVPKESPNAKSHAQEEPDFDFGSGMPLPTRRQTSDRPALRADRSPSHLRRPRSDFKKLGQSRDRELQDYLRFRNICPRFLHEIDIFLENHPEIAEHVPSFVKEFNSGTPLAAYKYFMKGYTRPARYRDNLFPKPSLDGRIQPPTIIPVLARAYDEELNEFFEGWDYRTDILQKMDREVARLCATAADGFRLKPHESKLINYAAYGNPVDAYKFYEYNYQTDWLPHRYLPEHVILSQIPLPPDYCEPDPSEERADRSWSWTRLKMARGRDAGVDVIEILLRDFVVSLASRGYRRQEIMEKERRARAALDRERDSGSGVDIVDLVFDMLNDSRCPNPHRRQPRNQQTHVRAPRASGMASVYKDNLRHWKQVLERLYPMEANMHPQSSEAANLRGRRARAEYNYILAFTDLGVAEGWMHQHNASNFREFYSPQNMRNQEMAGRKINILHACPPPYYI